MSPSNRDDPESAASQNGQSQWHYDEDDGPEASASESSDLHIGSNSSDSDEGQHSLPVWLRESSKNFHWRWVPLPIRKAARVTSAWCEGPDPPQMQKITPWFPEIQQVPARLIERYLPKRKHKAALLVFFYLAWFLIFSLVLGHSATDGYIEGYGKPQSIWCGASYWSGGNNCGLNGNRCRPFANATAAFRCPGNCGSIKTYSPYAVGDREIFLEPLVIGGPRTNHTGSPLSEYVYRGDSFVCQAAIHAGVISNKGGCGVVALTGAHSNFHSTTLNRITSFPFSPSFPKSFTFIPNVSSSCVVDLRWPLLAVTATFTVVLSLFTTSPAICFSSIFTMLFLHVGLVSDPPNISSLPALTSLLTERFLPASFVAYVLYRYCVRPQQRDLTANVERTLLWLGGAWIGALNNYTFTWIPVSRLTPHDLQNQPSAQIAVVLIVLLIFFIACGQIWYLRLEGRLPRYLAIYSVMAVFLLICVAIPWLNLRIHHYVLALLLLPGTRLQTRPSLLYQGLLVGLFINGIARWGFDSILQTTAALRGDGLLDTLLPNITAPTLINASSIAFSWPHELPSPYDGVSVLVNDVERWRWYRGEGDPGYTYERVEAEKAFFRFGYMSGSETGDYTGAGVWDIGGGWEGEGMLRD